MCKVLTSSLRVMVHVTDRGVFCVQGDQQEVDGRKGTYGQYPNVLSGYIAVNAD
jgi:hypothetical protein